MKATLEFQLPEDQNEHIRAIHAGTAWVTLYEIDNTLRNLLKHGDYRYKTVEDLASSLRQEVRLALDKIDE